MEKEILDDWDFKGEDTKEYTHGFHTYPAMMIPQIARKLIQKYGKESKVLLDPFCGSGTSLVEASLTPNLERAIGVDLNPLAVRISSVKTTPLPISDLEDYFNLIYNSMINSGKAPYWEVQKFKNIDFWFKEEAINDLSKLKKEIDKIRRDDIKRFFQIIFSEVVRNVSNTRNSEFKLYRMSEEKLKNFHPSVLTEFMAIFSNNIEGMRAYRKALNNLNRKKMFHCDIRFESSNNLSFIQDKSIDLIVTSPPYGDSKTTVAYGQFSRLALQWLGYNEASSIDNKLLGGKASKVLEVKIGSKTLKEIIDKIANKDEKRAREVLSFYEDFDSCVKEFDRVITHGGIICFVVGNRTVKGINIPTDKIMVEMFHAHGDYENIALHTRTIPNKRMPKENSPTNVKGEKVTTMNNEFIFVLKKK